MTTIAKFDTEYSADSVEFCPIDNLSHKVAVGTYQVLDRDENQTETQRTGRLYGFEADFNRIEKTFQTETNAILDMKWSHVLLLDDIPVLATADAKANIHFYNGLDYSLLTSFTMEKDLVLNLSLDWANRVNKSDSRLVYSQSDGFLNVLDFQSMKLVNSFRAHDYEAWIAAFDYWNTEIIYSGADDCLFKKFDLRLGTEPVLSSKEHSAGVCSIQSNPNNQHQVATGSYDETLRIWDTRSLKSPVSRIQLGGGIWRIKWHPTHPERLLVAAMHNGFHVLNLESDSSVHYSKHESLAYGADWSLLVDNLVATCSFYDHSLHFWTIL